MPQFDYFRSEIIERICEASPNKREKLIDKLIGVVEPSRDEPKNRRFDYDKEGKWTKALIADILERVYKEHGKLSVPLLRGLRKEDPEKYPAPSTVIYKFGSWQKAKRAAGVKEIHLELMGKDRSEDVGYFLALYHQFGITTRDLYHQGRRKYPQIVPPYRRLLDLFGTFTRFKKVASIDSCGEQVRKLAILVEKRNGRWPKRKDCKENNIDIKYLDRKFGSRRELKEFIADLRSVFERKEEDEKQRGSSR